MKNVYKAMLFCKNPPYGTLLAVYYACMGWNGGGRETLIVVKKTGDSQRLFVTRIIVR